MQNITYYQDDDDEGPIYDEVKLTAYDRRRMELRELEAKRDAIMAQDEISDSDQTRLAKLAPLISRAQERFDRESKRAQDDAWRKRRSIDAWRSDAGREEYNASRRKVRDHANTDLSDMTAQEKAQYKRDQKADANWFRRQREKGLNEAVITAAYAKRLEIRKQERETKAKEDADIAEIRARAIM
ncbi:hypothetical protein [Roseinatronobacter sp.]|uniref:hypothetical protein n=1 Tax=Roseinatronobacter sp. TaxID=1945755 RepID=UPI003F7284A3